jgi:hypothetical protein
MRALIGEERRGEESADSTIKGVAMQGGSDRNVEQIGGR